MKVQDLVITYVQYEIVFLLLCKLKYPIVIVTVII